MNPLRINAADLLRRPGTSRTVETVASLEELDVADPSRFKAGAEAAIHLRLESLSDGIVVEGELETPWIGICRRCLAPTAGLLTSEVHELFQRVVTADDAFELEGDQLDLRPVVRELILLDAPSTPLCQPDCAGLCATCGVNRNDEACDCSQGVADPRWSALDELREPSSDD